MPARRLAVALLAALALLAAACGGGSSGTDTETVTEAAGAAEAPAAQASLVADTIGGGQIDFGDLAGQDVVLWFWAPW